MYKCMEFRKQPPPILTLSLFSNKRCCVAFNISATQISRPRSIYKNSDLTPRLSGHISIFWFGFLCAQVSSGNCETMES